MRKFLNNMKNTWLRNKRLKRLLLNCKVKFTLTNQEGYRYYIENPFDQSCKMISPDQSILEYVQIVHSDGTILHTSLFMLKMEFGFVFTVNFSKVQINEISIEEILK